MKTILFNMIFLVALASCENNKTMPASSGITLMRSATEYNALINGPTENRGDPVNISDFKINGDSAYITLTYAGGCNQHTFELVWSEAYSSTYPPSTDLLFIHDAHGDACKALITETLSFNLRNLMGPTDYETILVNIFTGSMPSGTASTAQWNPRDINLYQVVFPEGDQCQVEVTASTVICGAGLWENMWFALNDSIDAGVEGTYFRKWLQPVAINEKLKGFKPLKGKRYLVGAKIRQKHPYNDVVVCLAYSGPSVPVEITCITELK